MTALDDRPGLLCPLNPLELTILRHLANGDTRATTGRAVGLAAHSVDNAVGRMIRKAGAVNAVSLTATALRKGWIQ